MTADHWVTLFSTLITAAATVGGAWLAVRHAARDKRDGGEPKDRERVDDQG